MLSYDANYPFHARLGAIQAVQLLDILLPLGLVSVHRDGLLQPLTTALLDSASHPSSAASGIRLSMERAPLSWALTVKAACFETLARNAAKLASLVAVMGASVSLRCSPDGSSLSLSCADTDPADPLFVSQLARLNA